MITNTTDLPTHYSYEEVVHEALRLRVDKARAARDAAFKYESRQVRLRAAVALYEAIACLNAYERASSVTPTHTATLVRDGLNRAIVYRAWLGD